MAAASCPDRLLTHSGVSSSTSPRDLKTSACRCTNESSVGTDDEVELELATDASGCGSEDSVSSDSGQEAIVDTWVMSRTDASSD